MLGYACAHLEDNLEGREMKTSPDLQPINRLYMDKQVYLRYKVEVG